MTVAGDVPAAPPPRDDEARSTEIWTRFGARYGRFVSTYLASNIATMVLSVVSVAVLTRYLDPSTYGRLTVLLLTSSLLAVVCTLGFLQGTNTRVFGSGGGGDDEDGDGEIPDEDVLAEQTHDKRRALTSGLVLVIGWSAGIAAVLIAGSPLWAPLLIGDAGGKDLFSIAVIAGALGGIWRWVANIPRYERRPIAYLLVNLLRPIAVLGVSIPLVASGDGLTGAILGVAIGTGFSILVALVVIRRSLGFGFSVLEMRHIERAGRGILPLIGAMWLLHNADTWVLSRVAPDATVGIYRVASRGAAFMSYFSSAFLMTWGPLRRTTAFAAMSAQRGIPRVGSMFFGYFTMLALWVLLAIAVGADVIVQIAAPSYRDAANLLPIIGVGFFLHGMFVSLYRLSTFPRKRSWITVWALVAAVILVVGTIALFPVMGAQGAALSTVLAQGSAVIGIYFTQRLGPESLPIELGRLSAAILVDGALYGVSRAAAQLSQPWATIGEVVAIIAFPLLLIGLRIVPAAHVRPLLASLRSMIRVRPEADALAAVARLPEESRRLLGALNDTDPTTVARLRGEPLPVVLGRAAQALATVAGVPPLGGDAQRIGMFLYSDASVAEIDAIARRLIAAGIDPGHLDEMGAALRTVKRVAAGDGDDLRPTSWRHNGNRPAPSSPAREIIFLTGEPVRPLGRTALHAAAVARAGFTATVLTTGASPTVHPGGGIGVTSVVPPGRLARMSAGPLRPVALRLALRVRSGRRPPALIVADTLTTLRHARRLAQRTGAAVLFDVPEDEIARLTDRRRGTAYLLARSYRGADAMRRQLSQWTRPSVVHDVHELPRGSARLSAALPMSVSGGGVPRAVAGVLDFAASSSVQLITDGAGLSADEAAGLIEAVSALSHVNLTVLAADHWPGGDALLQDAERRGCRLRVAIVAAGPGDHLHSRIRSSTAVICGSSGSGLPPLLLAALAEGRPTIVARGGESARALAANDGGTVVDFASSVALAEALVHVCVDRGQAAGIAAALSRTGQMQLFVGVVERALSPEPPDPVRAGDRVAARPWSDILRVGLRPRTAVARVRGYRHLQSGNPGTAATVLGDAASRDPADVRAALAHAGSLRALDRRDEATEVYRGIVDSEPTTSAFAVSAALNLARLGVRGPAEAVVEALLEAEEPKPLDEARAAELAVALRDLGRARKLIISALDRVPADNLGVNRIAARVLDQAGDPTRALTAARAASDALRIRRLAGVVRTLDADWCPTLPLRPLTRAGRSRRVLNLLETSLPHAHAGYVHRAATVLAAQRRAGFDPVAATRLGFPAARGLMDFADVELVDGVVHHRFAVDDLRQYTSIPPDRLLQFNAELLAPLVRQIAPVAVQAASPHFNGLLGLALGSAFELPVIYDVRGFPEMTWAAQDGGGDTEVYWRRREAETRCMIESDVVITLSEVMRDVIVQRGADPKLVHVVPHAVDVEQLRPQPPDPALVRRYGAEGRIVVGYVGSILDYEGIEVLVEAVAEARREIPELMAIIVGDGAALPTARALSMRLGAGDAIRFTGRVPGEEARSLYGIFDVVCVPRLDHEVCRSVTPLKPFEIMATGSCLLVSDVPALAATTAGGTAGRTFAAGDPRSCAAAIVELARDADLRAEIGRVAREQVVAEHHHEVVAQRIGIALHAAIDGASRARTIGSGPLPPLTGALT